MKRMLFASYNGIFILNQNFNVIKHIAPDTGLFTENVRSLHYDDALLKD